MQNTLISCKKLRKVFSEKECDLVVLDGVSFDVEKGSFTSLLGPSGCGKSTLLNIMRGLDELNGGNIEISGSCELKSIMSYVFQTARLLPWKKILDNITFVHAPDIPKKEIEKKAMKYLRLVGLDDFADHYPHQLSGGMQQRVGIARALSVEPEILLMDEPFSHLDEITARKMRADLVDIWQKTGVTIFFVTHDLSEAALLSDKIIFLTQKPTTVQEICEIKLSRPREETDLEFFELRKKLSGLFHQTI